MIRPPLRILPPVALTLWFVTLAGCSSAESSPGTTMVDSAGVALVTGPAEDHPLDWTFTQLFRLGGEEEGPGSFSEVHALTTGTDAAGHIYVLDDTQSRVEMFDARGNHVRFLGTRGAGPGEFGAMAGQLLVQPHGEVGVFDYGKRAVVRWSAEGEVLPELSIRSFFPSDPMLLRGDTLVYVHTSAAEGTRTKRLRIATPADTTDLAPLENPVSGMIMFSCIGLNMPPLFSRQLVWGSGAGRLAISHQTPYQVDLYEQGRLVRSVRRSMAPETPTLAHVEQLYPEGMQVRAGDGGCTVPSSELAEKQGLAATLPLLRSVTIGPAGHLWVERYTIGDAPKQVDLFDASGRYLGTAQGRALPLGFVGNDVVLFPEKDVDTDIIRIVAYRIGMP